MPDFRWDEQAVTETLKTHYLFNIVCNHEAKTDIAICGCSLHFGPVDSVGKARDLWIEHFIKELKGPALR